MKHIFVRSIHSRRNSIPGQILSETLSLGLSDMWSYLPVSSVFMKFINLGVSLNIKLIKKIQGWNHLLELFKDRHRGWCIFQQGWGSRGRCFQWCQDRYYKESRSRFHQIQVSTGPEPGRVKQSAHCRFINEIYQANLIEEVHDLLFGCLISDELVAVSVFLLAVELSS